MDAGSWWSAAKPGIGKTRLLGLLVDAGAGTTARAVLGRATELESDVPLAVLRDALPRLGPSAGAVAGTRWELFRGLTAELARRRGAVLVLDDVHWADPLSLELLAGLVRRPPDTAHAAGRRPAPRRRRRLAHRGGPLGRPAHLHGDRPRTTARGRDADALVGAEVSEAERGRLYEVSGGNPMFLEELARSDAGDGRA